MKPVGWALGGAALLICATPGVAFAEPTSITDYAVSITLPKSGSGAHFVLDLTYVDPATPKLNGFKYVGKEPVANLHAHDENGGILGSRASREGSSGEWKLEFDVPKLGLHERGKPQRVILEFDQVIPSQTGWITDQLELPWLTQFKIPVDRISIGLIGVPASFGLPDGFECRGSGASRECTRNSSGTEGLSMKAPRSISTIVHDALFMLVTFAIGIFWVRRADREKRKKVLATRGVLPVVEEKAYDVPVPEGTYRLPPPLPKPEQELQPELSVVDAADLKGRLQLAMWSLFLPVVIISLGRYPLELLPTSMILTLIATFLAGVFVSNEKRRYIFVVGFPLIVAASWFGATIGAAAALIASALASVLVGLVGIIANVEIKPGGRSSTYSSGSSCSSGSSSCGGGGGGGGGGCGGGGGGGGGGCGG